MQVHVWLHTRSSICVCTLAFLLLKIAAWGTSVRMRGINVKCIMYVCMAGVMHVLKSAFPLVLSVHVILANSLLAHECPCLQIAQGHQARRPASQLPVPGALTKQLAQPPPKARTQVCNCAADSVSSDLWPWRTTWSVGSAALRPELISRSAGY